MPITLTPSSVRVRGKTREKGLTVYPSASDK